ncbi:MAG TPA: phosphodiester glycosidase family protein, partial [Mycobacteriales bacterium]|nr:phosphodiester glycosidase family protein [Mycobacteriales bacterium]
HVLTVDMTNTNIAFGPLMRHVAQRSPLSQLASGRRRLVAATNTGYFDFNVGAPFGPVVYEQRPVTGTTAGSNYVGIGSNHRVYTGKLHLASTVTVHGVTHPLNGFNSLTVPRGLSLYTPRWGSEKVQVPWNGVSVYLTNGVISSKVNRYTSPPQPGQSMLVARGSTWVNWLKSLSRGTTVAHHLGYSTDAPVTIRQAYQVGAEIVQQKGVIRTGLSCRQQYPMPARNAIGWTDSHKKMIIAVVTDKPGTDVHGLDENQMSALMVELGSSRAYMWDGSGSAEMIARMPSTGRLSIRNYCADGQERWMPVGFGIFRRS